MRSPGIWWLFHSCEADLLRRGDGQKKVGRDVETPPSVRGRVPTPRV